MNFLTVIETVTTRLDEAGIRYALIGGFAMALRGVQRATVDLDFIEAASDAHREPDWGIIADYLDIFQQSDMLGALKSSYGEPQ